MNMMKGWMENKSCQREIYSVEFPIPDTLSDQIWIETLNFKVFESVPNLSDQIDLIFLILVPKTAWKTGAI